MNEVVTFLKSLGLDDAEVRVYMESLALGTVAASNIANKLKIPRSTVRYICENLVKKKLMTVTKRGNTKLFTPDNPTKLASLLYDEEVKLQKKRTQLPHITQSLQKIYNPLTSLPDVTFYEWVEWVEKVFLETAKDPGDVFTFSGWDYIRQKKPELIDKFREKVEKVNKTAYVIRPNKYRVAYNWKIKIQNRYFNSIDELKIDLQIHSDRVSIISMADDFPIWVVIRHKEIAEEFQKIFKELWGKCEKER